MLGALAAVHVQQVLTAINALRQPSCFFRFTFAYCPESGTGSSAQHQINFCYAPALQRPRNANEKASSLRALSLPSTNHPPNTFLIFPKTPPFPFTTGCEFSSSTLCFLTIAKNT